MDSYSGSGLSALHGEFNALHGEFNALGVEFNALGILQRIYRKMSISKSNYKCNINYIITFIYFYSIEYY